MAPPRRLQRPLAALLAVCAAAAWVVPTGSQPASQAFGSCPLKSLVRTAPVDTAACYKRQNAAGPAAGSPSWNAAPAGDAGAGAQRAGGRDLQEAIAAFNTYIGAAQIGATYHFTNHTIPFEGAERMMRSGARVHKFRLQDWLDGPNGRIHLHAPSLLDKVTDPRLQNQELFDLPISRFVFWAGAVNESNTYQEFYDFASYLINRYQDTGKSFYIGHWEGDWEIRENYRDPVIMSSVMKWRRSLSAMQRGIDDAKAAHADLVNSGKGVKVWGYAEVNRVINATRSPTYPSFINQVVPFIDPPIDFISYSNWEIEEDLERTADQFGPALVEQLDFINCHVPPKPCVPEPRVFVGEFGYFLRNNNCTPHLAPPVKSTSGGAMRDSTPEIVKARTLWHVANALAWGAPMALHWQLYNNEKGTDPATGQKCEKGYWLVEDSNQDAPLFTAFKTYYSDARGYLQHYARENGGALPDANTFRRWAVSRLADLAGYEGADAMPVPTVREWDLAKAAIAGGH